MDIKIKESIFLKNGRTNYLVRQGTTGVEENRVIFFSDVTHTQSVGFPRDFIFEHPDIFQINRNMSDREVLLSDVIKELSTLKSELTSEQFLKLQELLKSL